MTDHKKENELNQLFSPDSPTDSFGKIIGKARRKTLFRNVVISVLVLLLLTIAFGIAWFSVMRWQEAKALRDIELFSQITDPNIEEMGPQQQGNGLFESILSFERYKVIEGVPVDWSEETMTYSLFGGVSGFSGDHSYIQLEDEATGLMKSYDRETKQRVISFYHPQVDYKGLPNELNALERYSKGTVAEIALSFDQAYTPAEIRESMPQGVTLKWQWVDTYSSENLEWMNQTVDGELNSFPELANQVYGMEEFQLGEELAEEQSKSEEAFVERIQQGLSIENGKYYGEYKRIHDVLKRDSERLAAAHVQIIGAVVTGDVASLQSLQDLPIIRASTLGVTVKPYQ